MNNLKERIKVSWFRKTGKADGWEIWSRAIALNETGKLSQEAIARDFQVSSRTVNRWLQEYREVKNEKS